MNRSPQSTVTPAGVVRILASHPKRWLLPALVVALLAGLYALVRPATWEASQALIIRNEATNNRQAPGKFNHSDEMKTVQETILELVKSRGVLRSALAEVGPPAECRAEAAWPSDEDVTALRGQIKLAPPKGAEFGQTEVFYLNVCDHDRDRAVALARAICGQLEARFQELRDAKAQSMIEELVKSAKLARADLAESTARLTETEKRAGNDLAELRILQDSNSGESVLRRTINEVESELRQARAARDSSQELLAVLVAAKDDAGRLVATPNKLLESQPGLRRLKEGLVDAELRTAQLQGRMSALHPLVLAAKEAEDQIGGHLHDELAVAIRGIEVDLRLSAVRTAMLRERLEEATRRFARVASVRASYTNLLAENRNRSGLLQRAEDNLAEARAAQASAKATSLIARIDSPDAGTSPIGPGRATILLVGVAGGLLAGFGVLFLTVEPVPGAGSLQTPLDSAGAQGATAGNGKPPAGALEYGEGLSFKQALQKLTGTPTAWN